MIDKKLERRPRLSLISNPASGRNRNGLGTVERLLERRPDISHYQACSPEQLAAVLEDITAVDLPDVLAINAGDGTVQALLTLLYGRAENHFRPILALIPGGTTNMTAGDVGLRGGRDRALRKLLAWSVNPRGRHAVVTRPVLRVDPGAAQPIQCGMFFGTGAIIKGIDYCHKNVHSKGLRDGLAPGLCTLRILLAMARGETEYITPVTARMTTERFPPGGQTLEFPEQDQLIILGSGLERLFLGLRPYWGETGGAFYFSAVRARPAHILRALPPLFWGRRNRFATVENGYVSHKVDRLVLHMEGLFTLDGEIYHTCGTTGPLTVSMGGNAHFLQL